MPNRGGFIAHYLICCYTLYYARAAPVQRHGTTPTRKHICATRRISKHAVGQKGYALCPQAAPHRARLAEAPTGASLTSEPSVEAACHAGTSYPHDSLFQRLAAARWSRYALRFARAAAKR